MCDMYIMINWVYGPELKITRRRHIIQSADFGPYSWTHWVWWKDVPAPRELLNSHPPVLVPNPSRNIFIHYYLYSRGFFLYHSFHTPPFCGRCNSIFATVDWGSMIIKVHRCSVVFYGSTRAEFIGTKRNDHIHSHGTLIFGDIVVAAKYS